MFFFFFSSRRRHTRCSRDWSSDVCSSDLVRLQRAGVNVGTSTQAWATRVKVQRGDPGHLILEDEWRGLSEARINSSANIYRFLPATRAEILAFVLPVGDVDIVQPERQNAVCVGRLSVTVEVHPVPVDGDERLAFGRGRVDLRAESLWRSPVFGPGVAFRSEEHTSEPQSRLHLVCRLLAQKTTTTVALLTASALGAVGVESSLRATRRRAPVSVPPPPVLHGTVRRPMRTRGVPTCIIASMA